MKQILKVLCFATLSATTLTACQSSYYSVMESVGVHKREILVDRVNDANEAQTEAQEQFKSALQQLSELVNFDGGDLEAMYNAMSDQYEASQESADRVTGRIDKIESVADALFEEWEDELEQYTSEKLKRNSMKSIRDTKRRYEKLMRSMRKAESRMQPVLAALKDNTLYLKHNLNARAIGSLQGELQSIKNDVELLIKEMNGAIEQSQQFIETLKQ